MLFSPRAVFSSFLSGLFGSALCFLFIKSTNRFLISFSIYKDKVFNSTNYLLNLTIKSQSSCNHKTCMIPLDWFIQSRFGLDDALINSNVRDKFLLACSSVHRNEDHFEESSFCQRSIYRANDSEL